VLCVHLVPLAITPFAVRPSGITITHIKPERQLMVSNHRLYRSIAVATAGLDLHCQVLRPSFISLFAPLPGVVRRTNSSFKRMSETQTNEEPNTFIDKLALILLNSNNKQLVARSFGKSVYYTPGGKRDPGETDEEALVRECMEELSVNLKTSTNKPANIEPYGVFQAQAYNKPPGIMVRMTCFRITPREAELELEKYVKASAEIEELKWIDSTFDREKLTVTGIMILDDLKEKNLID
jgi:8-oxo-dGTP diphosphatase